MRQNDTYMAYGGGNRSTSLDYDSSTGKWVPKTPSSKSSNSSNPPSLPAGKVPEANPTSKVDSKKTADKEYIEVEFNTLTGELTLTPTEKSIRIKVNDTIQLEGVGKYLSGLYFVTAVKRTLNNSSGYTQTISVIKNGFGDSLKKSQETVETRKETIPKSASGFNSGDSVRIVGDDAIYSNAHDGVKVPNWVKSKDLTIQQVSSDGTRVLLMPINSWTYTKYVQKF